MNNRKYINRLITETSPYLLQHAHNPVQWYPWGDEALNKAKAEDKLIIVSIGYSACHWCHVMERETFEDEAAAKVMNDNFVCIKVDREERPDIDQVYMSAVQLMTGHGGWPLNCITLPDGRPIYGGTYFRKEQWVNVLNQLSAFYKTEKDKAYEYAEKLIEGINRYDIVGAAKNEHEFSFVTLQQSVERWRTMFDKEYGGLARAPKFPMPNNYLFLLRYGFLSGDKSLTDFVEHTLKKIAYGGIYDHIGGGFARYSVDAEWKVPHFEKMLYDNAQLISLYTEAYRYSKNELYKNVVYETCEFVLREMTSPEGAFYSAYDADSEGVEGKFYVWEKQDLKDLLNNDFDLFAEYYNVNERGYWEHGTFILLRHKDDEELLEQFNLSLAQLNERIKKCKSILFLEREKRVKPGLDDKSLTSWNGLMLKAFADAYMVFNEPKFLEAALQNANFIFNKQLRSDGGVNHSYKDGKSTINGFLEDYAFTIEALLALYSATFNELYLTKATKLIAYTIDKFYDTSTGVFWFTSSDDVPLITRKMEIADNVISASNSVMANNLFLLGRMIDDENYVRMSSKMLNNVLAEISQNGPSYSNWAVLLLYRVYSFTEIIIVGEKARRKAHELYKNYIPSSLTIGAEKKSDLSLLRSRFIEGKTLVYVCKDKTCSLPEEEIQDVLKNIV